MKLPNGDRAVVDIAKLRDYCLNRGHPRGKHKARVFSTALGLTDVDAEALQSELADVAKTSEAMKSDADEFGQRYVIDFPMVGPTGSARVRCTWIIRTDEDFPRLTSCYRL